MKPFLFIVLCTLMMRTWSQTPSFTVTLNKLTGECRKGSAAVHIEGAASPLNILWSNGATSDSVSNLEPGDYAVTVKDTAHPDADTTIYFNIGKFSCRMTFNNRFTPNGDGINDTWGISSEVILYPKFLLQVYDRWGQLVHQQRGQYTPWDGTHLGLNLPDATYYYVFFYEEGKTKDFERGDVTIVR